MQVDIRKDVIVQQARQIPVSHHGLLPRPTGLITTGVISDRFHFQLRRSYWQAWSRSFSRSYQLRFMVFISDVRGSVKAADHQYLYWGEFLNWSEWVISYIINIFCCDLSDAAMDDFCGERTPPGELRTMNWSVWLASKLFSTTENKRN